MWEKGIYVILCLKSKCNVIGATSVAQTVKNLPAMRETLVQSSFNPGSGRSLEKGMATHSSILAWRTSWTEEPGGLQSIGSKRVGYDWSNLAHTPTQTYENR